MHSQVVLCGPFVLMLPERNVIAFFAFPRMILRPPPYSCENHLKKQWLAQCLFLWVTLWVIPEC